MLNVVNRLIESIGYPKDEILPGAGSVTLKVDAFQLGAYESAGRLVLTYELKKEPEEGDLRKYAQFAAGRILREDATLAYDPNKDAIILWQAVDAQSGSAILRSFFEDFTHAVDWWRERAQEAETKAPEFPDMVFRP